MVEERYDYRNSNLYRMWSRDCGFDEGDMAQEHSLDVVESRAMKRIRALLEYVQRSVERAEESCLEPLILGRALAVASTVTKVIRSASEGVLDAIRSDVLAIEDDLRRANVRISKEHDLRALFSERDRMLLM